jgi:hypothetical protein
MTPAPTDSQERFDAYARARVGEDGRWTGSAAHPPLNPPRVEGREWAQEAPREGEAKFDALDLNGDGVLTREEWGQGAGGRGGNGVVKVKASRPSPLVAHASQSHSRPDPPDGTKVLDERERKIAGFEEKFAQLRRNSIDKGAFTFAA